MNQFILRPAAVADVRAAYRWYQTEREGLGEEFLAAVRACIDKVVRAPHAYPVVHRETRRALIHRFPHGLFFRVADEQIVIVACYHLHRRPATWKRRR